MKIYTIIKHDKIGGAEKRFAGLWANLVAQKSSKQYFLVLSQVLLEELLCIDDLKQALEKYRSNIIIHQFNGGYIQNSTQAYKLIKGLKSRDSYFHFIEFFPAFFPIGSKLIFSITASNFGIYTFKGRVSQYLATFFSKRVDVLDPKIYSRFQNLFFYKKKNIFLTPCTYCNNEKFVIEKKENWIIFLGIFTPIKQPLKYLQSIPNIYKKLEPLQLSGIKFFLLGSDDMEDELKEELKLGQYKNMPIELKFTPNPEDFLNKSKVFVSLQKFNNYPSKSLVEALSSGNVPVVTDNGQTRLIADETFSYYVKEDFEKEEIASAINEVFSLSGTAFQEKSNLARAFVLNNHTLLKMSEYYKNSLFNIATKN